jgi:hypothetical protein
VAWARSQVDPDTGVKSRSLCLDFPRTRKYQPRVCNVECDVERLSFKLIGLVRIVNTFDVPGQILCQRLIPHLSADGARNPFLMFLFERVGGIEFSSW